MGSAASMRAQVPLFATLSPPQRSQLCTALKPLHVKAGTAIVQAGDTGNTFYIVEAGTCLVQNLAGQVHLALRHSLHAHVPGCSLNQVEILCHMCSMIPSVGSAKSCACPYMPGPH